MHAGQIKDNLLFRTHAHQPNIEMCTIIHECMIKTCMAGALYKPNDLI